VGATGYTCGTCDAGWSGANCDVPITCSGATAPTNGTVSAPSTTFGLSVTYGCNAGFTLTGSATATCQAGGTFTGPAPTCAITVAALSGFGPPQSFIDVGQTASPTIPTPLTVTISGPVTTDTDVVIASGDPAKLTVVGGKVTILAGQTSAAVQVNGLAQSLNVILTATLGTSLMANVRVINPATEQPSIASLTPAAPTVTAGGTVPLTVTLDMPAPAGGTSVALALSSATAGTIPVTVTVPADQLSATFSYVDGSAATSATVTATLGASTASSTITITPPAATIVRSGPPGAMLLRGTVVTPTSVFKGEVLVEGDVITCAAASCNAMPAAATATIVSTGGIIFPGLIDTHDHVTYAVFDGSDWAPTQIYTNHTQWTAEVRYKAMVDADLYLSGQNGGVDLQCELSKYGELKQLLAGATSIVGAATPVNSPCHGSLARTIDQSANGLGADKIQTATLLPTRLGADAVCANFTSGATDAYLIHVAEGVDQTARNELAALGTVSTTSGCLYSSRTAVVHGTALGTAELDTMAANGMSLVWSPHSDVLLYGGGSDFTKTANIPAALTRGINIALGPGFPPSGSANILDELRFADQTDRAAFGHVLTPRVLVDMVTTHAARALGLGATLGSIEVGKKADLLVIGGDASKPYDALLAAKPRDIRLVLVGGVALYGDSQLGPLGPATPGCEALDVCGATKFVCVAQANTASKLGQTLPDIRAALEQALTTYDGLNLSAFDFMPLAPLVTCN
jgi:cytosine/adenosine deaminase-related metal-dependent hydrolase